MTKTDLKNANTKTGRLSNQKKNKGEHKKCNTQSIITCV